MAKVVVIVWKTFALSTPANGLISCYKFQKLTQSLAEKRNKKQKNKNEKLNQQKLLKKLKEKTT